MKLEQSSYKGGCRSKGWMGKGFGFGPLRSGGPARRPAGDVSVVDANVDLEFGKGGTGDRGLGTGITSIVFKYLF